MTFCEFANKLRKVISSEGNTMEFTRNLFINITDYNDSDESPIKNVKLIHSSFISMVQMEYLS